MQIQEIGKMKALIIAISDYVDKKLKPLAFCRTDGNEMYKVLKSIGYGTYKKDKLIGRVKGETMKEAIYNFFTAESVLGEDTLLFYYSGHGVPDSDGDMYLASSEINPEQPFKKGFSFNELTKMMNRSNSSSIVSILDCCYSGAAKLSKGSADAAAKLGAAAIKNRSEALQRGEGKCILSASQAAQEAYAKKKGIHSVFTYYLLDGLKVNKNSVDIRGNVTVDSLGTYIYNSIMNLPADKRPKQKPVRKVEAGGDIILAHYPDLIVLETQTTLGAPGRGPASTILYQNDYLFENMHLFSALNEVKGASKSKIAVLTPGRAEKEHDALKDVKLSQYRSSDEDDSWGRYPTSLCSLLASPKLEKQNFIGVAPNSELLAYEISQKLDETFYSDLISAISEAAAKRPEVMLISLGTDSPPPHLEEKINDVVASGITVVSPAGNNMSSTPKYPAAYESVLSVAAIKEDDIKADFSNFGDTVDICAYGTNVWSAINDNRWDYSHGTSYSACLVAGAVALLYTVDPTLKPNEVHKIIRMSADNIDYKNRPFKGKLGAGKMNVYRALIKTKERMHK